MPTPTPQPADAVRLRAGRISVAVAVSLVVIGVLRFATDTLHETDPDYWQALAGTPLRYLVRAPSDGTLLGDLNAQFFKLLSIPSLLCALWLTRRFGAGSLATKAAEFVTRSSARSGSAAACSDSR